MSFPEKLLNVSFKTIRKGHLEYAIPYSQSRYLKLPRALKETVYFYYPDSDDIPHKPDHYPNVHVIPLSELPFSSDYENFFSSKNFKKSLKPKIEYFFTHNDDFTAVSFKKINSTVLNLELNRSEAKIVQRLFSGYHKNGLPWVSAETLLEGITGFGPKPSINDIFKRDKIKWREFIIPHPSRRSLYSINLPKIETFQEF